jgi:hypothetical protein
MSKDMKVIMERWDRYVLLENETLEKIKDSEVETKNLIQQISKTQDKEQLQNFLNIVSQDEEIMDLVSSFKKMKEIIEKEKINEGPLDDLLNLPDRAAAEAITFFNTDLGKKITTYGLPAAAIAFMALKLHQGGFDPLMATDAIQLVVKGKSFKAADFVGMVAGIDTAGNVMGKRDV